MDVGKVSVDVEMVGVHRRDHRDFRIELQEGPVELVRLGHDGGRVAHEHVRAVVLGYPAEECRAALAALGEDMGHQRGRGGLAVRAGYREAFLAARDFAEHAGTLDYPVSALPCCLQFLQVFGDGRRIDYEGLFGILRNQVRPVLEMDRDAFRYQFGRQGRGGAVVAGHRKALEFVVAGYGAHSYAAYPY